MSDCRKHAKIMNEKILALSGRVRRMDLPIRSIHREPNEEAVDRASKSNGEINTGYSRI